MAGSMYSLKAFTAAATPSTAFTPKAFCTLSAWLSLTPCSLSAFLIASITVICECSLFSCCDC
nr:MAG TPA: hypothetical protein [Caudoviricetes sp.]